MRSVYLLGKIMSVALFIELVNYEGKNVYEDVLFDHIGDVQNLLKRCESLKTYDANLTKSVTRMIRETVDDTKTTPSKALTAKIAEKISKLNFASIKQYIDECNGFETHEELPSRLYEQLTLKLWDLFSLSACSDHLLWLWQQSELTVAEYSRFFTEVGMQVSNTENAYYHPFYHEIYYVDDEVNLGEEDQIVMKSQLYPMIMFGNLQFSRAGVIVYDHPCIDKNLAENSDLYFVNCRENRKRHDLSDGWGSNSRWRTNFVRNYETQSEWKFNVDGKIDLRSEQDYVQECESYGGEVLITIEAARELLVNRHFVHPNKISPELQSDLFPYDWRLNISKANFNYVRWIKKMRENDNLN